MFLNLVGIDKLILLCLYHAQASIENENLPVDELNDKAVIVLHRIYGPDVPNSMKIIYTRCGGPAKCLL